MNRFGRQGIRYHGFHSRRCVTKEDLGNSERGIAYRIKVITSLVMQSAS